MLFQTTNALGFPLLSLAIFLPLLGAAVIAILPAKRDALYLAAGLFVSGIVLAIATILLVLYDPNWGTPLASLPRQAVFQFADPATAPASWLPGGIGYQVAVDGIAVVLVFLTALLTFLALLFSLGFVRDRVRGYVIAVLVLETGVLGVFCAMDLFLFYVFWEAALIPMYFLVGIWGGAGRIYATFKFVVYTMAGSALMLVAIIAVALLSGTSSFHLFDLLYGLPRAGLSPSLQMLLFFAFALAFAVKIPLFPLHTWLPDAHVQAPTAGSVLLAGVLLKLGSFGFVRLAIPLFPAAAERAMPWLMALAIVGIWYGAWVAFAQKDVKSLVAYSSVSHMGMVMIGIFALNNIGLSGGVLQMVNHGIITGALFLLVGMLYERAHTREIASFGGLWKSMPRYSVIFLVVMFASIGLPGTAGFVGEWLSLLGAFLALPIYAVLAVFGVLLGAIYMLSMYLKVFFGESSSLSESMTDITTREVLILAPLVILIFWIGIYPAPFLTPIEASGAAWTVYLQEATEAVTASLR